PPPQPPSSPPPTPPPPITPLFPYTTLFRSRISPRRGPPAAPDCSSRSCPPRRCLDTSHRRFSRPPTAREKIVDVKCPGSGEVDKDRKSTRLNSSHVAISYAVFCLKKKKKKN